MKTKREIIEETIKFYNSNNRAVQDRSTCKYLTDDGKMCAVGRCLTDEDVRNVGDFQGDVDSLVKAFKSLDEMLKPEYRGHDQQFWRTLQTLHDDPDNWNEDGFAGSREFIETIFRTFDLDS